MDREAQPDLQVDVLPAPGADGVQLDRLHFEVLNSIVLKKMASAGSVSSATGVTLAEVDGAMRDLEQAGHIVLVGEQALAGDSAQGRVEEYAAACYAELRRDGEAVRLADQFEVVNRRFLDALALWHQVDVGGRKVTNDHGDPEYDAKVVTRVDRAVQQLCDILGALSRRDPRFERYARRLEVAMRRVDEGDTAYVSTPTVDSVHNVWFEFHEDLLRTMGRARRE
jgi:hypothetical protein